MNVTAKELLDFQPEQPITEAGLRNNINVGIQYLGAWLAGNGCVPIYNLMEDAATAEISRSQIWQWIRSPKGVLEDGRKVTAELSPPPPKTPPKGKTPAPKATAPGAPPRRGAHHQTGPGGRGPSLPPTLRAEGQTASHGSGAAGGRQGGKKNKEWTGREETPT